MFQTRELWLVPENIAQPEISVVPSNRPVHLSYISVSLTLSLLHCALRETPT